MSRRCLRVGAIVLTHNSSEDLRQCLAGLAAQRGVDLRLIAVDNASRPDERARMEVDFLETFPGARVLAATEAAPDATSALPAVFLRSDVNHGYSAGNNIGARLAAAIGCDAVLIVNPDVRICDPTYVGTLADRITKDPRTAVACSALRNLSGAQENPVAEPSFLVELLWPITMLVSGISRNRRRESVLPCEPTKVAKVSGACFMIRTDFLHQIGFFDEATFLYCEESILMAQVQALGWHMVMDPHISALHAHRSGAKGGQLPRFRIWARSRRHFHRSHGKYGMFRRGLLAASREIMLYIVHAKGFSNFLAIARSRAPRTK